MWTSSIAYLVLIAALFPWFYGSAALATQILLVLVACPLLYIGLVFALQWYCWYCHEQAEINGQKAEVVTKGSPSKTNRILFCGPRAALIERIHIAVSHTPMFCYMLYKVLVNRIIPFTWRYMQPGYKNTTATDAMIFELLTRSSLITIAIINKIIPPPIVKAG